MTTMIVMNDDRNIVIEVVTVMYDVMMKNTTNARQHLQQKTIGNDPYPRPRQWRMAMSMANVTVDDDDDDDDDYNGNQ